MQAFDSIGDAHHAPRFFLQRGTLRPNWEVPARAAALREGLARLGFSAAPPPPVSRDALLTVHTPGYLDFLAGAAAGWAALPDTGPELVANIHAAPEMLAQGGRPGPGVIARAGWYTADTACPIGPGTWDAAQAAAAAALAAAAEAAAGRSAYALCRPPGHHAYAARAGGHCYLNNAALAAEALTRRGARIAVLDIDSHHGNGTQGVFWTRDDVLTVSVHADPDHYYPWFVGRTAERGAGDAEGCNLNLPLPLGTGDLAWLAAIGVGLDAIRDFGAEALVLSLGFDASEHEPLAALSVTADGFFHAGQVIAGLGVPTAIVQEGGYAVDRLATLLARFLAGWLDA